MYQIVRILISASPVVMGVYLLFGVLANIAASNSASSWPMVTGTITETQVSGVFSLYDRQSYLSYTYQVDGIRYTGHKVGFGNGAVSGYRVNQAISVYFNSYDHQASVLEVGFRSSYFVTAFIAVGLILVGKILWKRLE